MIFSVSPFMILSCIENSVVFSFSNWLKHPQLKWFEKEPCLPLTGKQYERKKKTNALCLSFLYILALLMKLELLQGMYGFEKKWFSSSCCVSQKQNQTNGCSQCFCTSDSYNPVYISREYKMLKLFYFLLIFT